MYYIPLKIPRLPHMCRSPLPDRPTLVLALVEGERGEVWVFGFVSLHVFPCFPPMGGRGVEPILPLTSVRQICHFKRNISQTSKIWLKTIEDGSIPNCFVFGRFGNPLLVTHPFFLWQISFGSSEWIRQTTDNALDGIKQCKARVFLTSSFNSSQP